MEKFVPVRKYNGVCCRAFLTFNLHVEYYQLDVGICVVLISIICVFCIFANWTLHVARHVTGAGSSFWDRPPIQIPWS